MSDVFTHLKRVKERFPPGSRDPEQMRLLWRETMDLWNRLPGKPAHFESTSATPDWQRQWNLDAKGFLDRMKVYDVAIATSTSEEDLAPKIRGFIIDDPETLHIVDVAQPVTLGNQLEAGRQAMDGFLEDFWKDIETGLVELKETADRGTSSLTNLLWASAALVGVWTIYKVVKETTS